MKWNPQRNRRRRHGRRKAAAPPSRCIRCGVVTLDVLGFAGSGLCRDCWTQEQLATMTPALIRKENR